MAMKKKWIIRYLCGVVSDRDNQTDFVVIIRKDGLVPVSIRECAESLL